MDKFEYVVALVAVIAGVGLSDVAVSLHRLLKRRGGVSWDWRPVVLALYAAMVLIRLWYQLWGVHDEPSVTGHRYVAVQVIQTLVLVLVASAALPDEDDFRDGRVDLRAYHDAHVRYIWTAYLVFLVLWAGTGIYFQWLFGNLAFVLNPFFSLYFLLPIALTALALFVGRRAQGIILLLLVVHEVMVPSNFFDLRYV